MANAYDAQIDDIYYNFDTANNTEETSNEQMEALEGLGITDEELKQNFTGIIFKVPAGKVIPVPPYPDS